MNGKEMNLVAWAVRSALEAPKWTETSFFWDNGNSASRVKSLLGGMGENFEFGEKDGYLCIRPLNQEGCSAALCSGPLLSLREAILAEDWEVER